MYVWRPILWATLQTIAYILVTPLDYNVSKTSLELAEANITVGGGAGWWKLLHIEPEELSFLDSKPVHTDPISRGSLARKEPWRTDAYAAV